MQSYNNMPVQPENESDDWESVEEGALEEGKQDEASSDKSETSEYDEESDANYTMSAQPLPVMSKPELSSSSSSSED